MPGLSVSLCAGGARKKEVLCQSPRGEQQESQNTASNEADGVPHFRGSAHRAFCNRSPSKDGRRVLEFGQLDQCTRV